MGLERVESEGTGVAYAMLPDPVVISIFRFVFFLILSLFFQNKRFNGDLTHTVSPNLMLILSTYRVVLHLSYLQKSLV